jgi:hypothetical protein
MAPDTQTFQISDDVKFSGSIVKQLAITWNGSLQTAVLKGTVSGWVTGTGIMGLKIKVNGAEAYTDPNQVIVAGITQFVGDHSADIGAYMKQGTNQIEFVVTQVFGEIATTDFAVSDALTIQSTGTISIVPTGTQTPAGTDYQSLALLVIAVIVIAVAAGLFLRARG